MRALNGVSITIDYGEFVAIAGASGSGKSTMMNVLGCLDVPTYGEYYLAGEDVSEMNDKLSVSALHGRIPGDVMWLSRASEIIV